MVEDVEKLDLRRHVESHQPLTHVLLFHWRKFQQDNQLMNFQSGESISPVEFPSDTTMEHNIHNEKKPQNQRATNFAELMNIFQLDIY